MRVFSSITFNAEHSQIVESNNVNGMVSLNIWHWQINIKIVTNVNVPCLVMMEKYRYFILHAQFTEQNIHRRSMKNHFSFGLL